MKPLGISLKDMTLKFQRCERQRGIVLKPEEVQITFGVIPKYRNTGFDFDRHHGFDI